jgi:hypothetical protein
MLLFWCQPADEIEFNDKLIEKVINITRQNFDWETCSVTLPDVFSKVAGLDG